MNERPVTPTDPADEEAKERVALCSIPRILDGWQAGATVMRTRPNSIGTGALACAFGRAAALYKAGLAK